MENHKRKMSFGDGDDEAKRIKEWDDSGCISPSIPSTPLSPATPKCIRPDEMEDDNINELMRMLEQVMIDNEFEKQSLCEEMSS
jgi:hypothetical protein